jgi:hypothetical protein
LIKYGGIFIDGDYITVDSFDWILDIANYPSEMVFNRFGDLPKVLMYFYPHYGQPFYWTFNATANTKSMWHCSYDSNLIIAEANQMLLIDWFEEYFNFYNRSLERTD